MLKGLLNWFRGNKHELLTVPAVSFGHVTQSVDLQIDRSKRQRQQIERVLDEGPRRPSGIVIADILGGREYLGDGH